MGVNRHSDRAELPSAQIVAEKVFTALERFLHVEAVSGIVLLVAAGAALVWANSPAAESYHHFWDAPLSVSFGAFSLSRSLHFVINEGLMTVFFLVVGMEIRREMHEGALADLRVAVLPLAAALGGVAVPAVFYLLMNGEPASRDGWAVPTATDIAFAVGVLAILGKSVPASIRIFLLALAIIDDIAAVVIIAAFYSGGLQYEGLIIAAAGVLLVLGLQSIGVGTAFAYVIPGAIVWFGLLQTGAHPTLAGVLLGLMTPVVHTRMRERPVAVASQALSELESRIETRHGNDAALLSSIKRLRLAQRELLPPVVRIQSALHPWVAYLVMPLFALANAGVNLNGVDIAGDAPRSIMLGVVVALVAGKPVGIFLGTWIAVRLRLCQLPAGVTWGGVFAVGCLGGIGFTMSIFIATLAFPDVEKLAAAKLGVLVASVIAGVAGLLTGRVVFRKEREELGPTLGKRTTAETDAEA